MRVKGGRSITGVDSSETGTRKCNGRAQKCIRRHGSTTSEHRSVRGGMAESVINSYDQKSKKRNVREGKER